MEWSNLELRKASVLRKEGMHIIYHYYSNISRAVDVAIRAIQAAVEKDDQEKLKQLIDAIQAQINTIEVFYAKNEDGTS